MHNKAKVAVLVAREHSRLSNQSKALQKVLDTPYSDKTCDKLLKRAQEWNRLLAYDECRHRVVNALEGFVEAYRQGAGNQQELLYEVIFQIGIYRKTQWSYVRFHWPEVNDCLDHFGNVKPRYKEAFRDKYEHDQVMPVEDQSKMLKGIYAKAGKPEGRRLDSKAGGMDGKVIPIGSRKPRKTKPAESHEPFDPNKPGKAIKPGKSRGLLARWLRKILVVK